MPLYPAQGMLPWYKVTDKGHPEQDRGQDVQLVVLTGTNASGPAGVSEGLLFYCRFIYCL